MSPMRVRCEVAAGWQRGGSGRWQREVAAGGGGESAAGVGRVGILSECKGTNFFLNTQAFEGKRMLF